MKTTNPDAPISAHAITVRHRGVERLAAPIALARRAYAGGTLFDYAQPSLVAVTPAGDVVHVDGAPLLISYADADGFYDQVGRNTGYIVHPEEILAENFRMLVMGGTAPASGSARLNQ